MNLEFKFIYLKREKQNDGSDVYRIPMTPHHRGNCVSSFFSLNAFHLFFSKQSLDVHPTDGSESKRFPFFSCAIFLAMAIENDCQWEEQHTHTKKKYKRKGMIRKNVSSVQILKNKTLQAHHRAES